MTNKSNIIEVNGKRYDARTGRLLGSSANTSTSAKKPATKPKPGRALDGFNHKHPSTTLRTVGHPSTAHAVHHKTEKSKTLMRAGVMKPTVSPDNKLHSKASVTHSAPAASIMPKSAPRVALSPGRALRAQHVNKSSLISKFGGELSKLTHQTAVLPVKAAPGEPEQTLPPQVSHEANMFQRALEQATSHHQPKLKKQKVHHRVAKRLNTTTRVVNIGAGSLGVLLIAGFFAFQNVPNLALRVASARAGIHGTMPGYHPSGYGVKGAVQYSPGQIVITYGSHSDDRQFSLTQRKSEWNNETLVSNFVAVDKRPYQTYQDNSRTIYMYGDSNATWVEDGVWFQIEGKSALSSDQLIRMASSL